MMKKNTKEELTCGRFIAIVKPLRPRLSRSMSIFILILIWLSGAIISLPNILYSQTISYRYPDDQIRTVCLLTWDRSLDYRYNIFFLVITYIVPMSTMGITYPWMSIVLWASPFNGDYTYRHKLAMRAKRKVVRMLIIVVIIFGICWLPYHVYFLAINYYPSLTHTDTIQHIYLGIYWLAMSNSLYNPIIYYQMNSRFRCYFQSILCFRTKKDK